MSRATERGRTLSLAVSTPSEEQVDDPEIARISFLPWSVAAILGGLSAVLLGWLAVGVLVAASWLTATAIPFASALDAVGQGWLALHGAPARLGPLTLDLPPLSLSALAAFAVAAASAHAAGQRDLGADAPRRERQLALGAVVGVSAGSYALGALVLASVVGSPTQATEALGGALVIGVVGALAGALRPLVPGLGQGAPAWVRALPRALAAGVLALAAGATLALVVGLVMRRTRFLDLLGALDAGWVGGLVLVLLHVAYAPTILLWSGAYTLGAGVTLGAGTVVAPGVSVLGPVPAIPVLAALPEVGTPWDWAWLWVGVVAGAVASISLTRDAHRADAPPDRLAWAWQGALAALGSAGVWLLASWLARGDLGLGRLVGVGPRFPELLWLAPASLLVGGTLAGFVHAWMVLRRSPGPALEQTALESAVLERTAPERAAPDAAGREVAGPEVAAPGQAASR